MATGFPFSVNMRTGFGSADYCHEIFTVSFRSHGVTACSPFRRSCPNPGGVAH